ncbi:MAG: MBL fold metallo-hydrolase [Ignavibacteriales bacterium]
MSIQYQILGKPGRDNALMVWVNGGTQMYRLLFDCGENLLHELKQSDVKSIDYLFFSHLHIDHVAGFDYFFRRNYDRDNKPVYVWGPADTASIIGHRLQGFKWNLAGSQPGIWYITDIFSNKLVTKSYRTSEGFSIRHDEGETETNGVILDTPDFQVRYTILNHIIPTIAYAVTEKNSFNINKDALSRSGLTAGSWLERLKDLSVDDSEMIEVDNAVYSAGDLRQHLLLETPGDSIAYLTDFIYDGDSGKNAAGLMHNCNTVVCESQYSAEDEDLARRNFHMTTLQTASLAREAQVKKLLLFHISERYTARDDYPGLLKEARSIFPETYFPSEWDNYINP